MKIWIIGCGLATALFAGGLASDPAVATEIRANGMCITPLYGYDYGMDRNVAGSVEIHATRIGSGSPNGFDLSAAFRKSLKYWELAPQDKAYLDPAYQPRKVIVPLSLESNGTHMGIPESPEDRYFIIAILEADPAEARRLLDSIAFCD